MMAMTFWQATTGQMINDRRSMSGGLGAFAGNHIVFAEQVEKASFLEFESAIGLAALVDQQGKLDSCLFAEGFCILHISESYSR